MADFDVIIVGAGIAGSTAAYKLASEGTDVLLVDRATSPGAKNLSGGVFYGRVLADLIPGFYDEAPIQRRITRNSVVFLRDCDALTIDYSSRAFAGSAEEPANGFSVLRAEFDAWLARKAESAGATLVPGILVDGLLLEGGACKGIVADGEEMTSECVIVADGVNSTLTQMLGQRDSFGIANMGVGVKQVYELGEDVINERFRCRPGEGVAYGILGDCTGGMPGGCFLYTNATSVSVGLVVHVDHLAESRRRPYEMLDAALANPEIARMIEGGKLVEYGAHMVCEGGMANLPKSLWGDGWMIAGDAAGFAANNGFVVRGMDFAAASGLFAAQAALGAKAAGDWSQAGLSSYGKMLDDSFVMEDMKTYAKASALMKDEHLYTTLNDLANNVFAGVYRQDSRPKKNLSSIACSAVRGSDMGLFGLGSLAWKAVRSL